MTDAIRRQHEYDSVLTKQPQTLAQIHAKIVDRGFRVHRKTVARDLELLSTFKSIDKKSEGKLKVWFLVPSIFDSLPGVKSDEALVFLTLKKYCERLLPVDVFLFMQPHFDLAQRALSNQFPHQRDYRNEINASEENSMRNWLAKIHVLETNQKLLAPIIDDDVRRDVYTAVLRGKQVNLSYKKNPLDTTGGVREYKNVNLLGLVEHGAAIYVIANFSEYPDIRSLALHRVTAIEILDKDIEPPDNFDLASFIELGGMGLGGSGEEIQLQLKLFESQGKHLVEMPLSQDQTYEQMDDSTLLITATVRNNQRLLKWILGFGASAEVVAPPSLRDQVRTALQGGLGRYYNAP